MDLIPCVIDEFSTAKPRRLFNGQADIASGYDEDEDEKEIRFSLDLPGVKVSDLDIAVKEKYLVVSGARRLKSLNGSNAKKAKFTRAFVIDPEKVDIAKIKANLADGVLSVTIPKKPKAEPIKILVTNHPHNDKQVDTPSVEAIKVTKKPEVYQ